MKQYLYLFFYFLCVNVVAQNIPAVTVKDAQDLKLTDLKVSVAIVGNLAVTTYDMKFYNGLNRTLEGELVFPLAEGQTVSGFAMDVNGKMRDAVIVEKELGRVAYETTIRRKIDPGLLEKTEGNNYKARVYPIFPKRHKHIILKFEQELSTLDGKQTYELPLGIMQNLDTFSILLNVFNEQQPIVSKTNYKGFFFKKKEEVFVATISKNNHAPTNPIVIQIPNSVNQENLTTYNGYFHYYKALQPSSQLKKKPKKVTILWDASYSMRSRDVKNELKVLKEYLSYLRNVKVNFIAFNNRIQTQKEFKIKDGETSDLLTEIQNVQYDGGTKLNLFKDVKIKADEVLLFSDGLANLGDFSIKKKMPVYTINSLVSSNHQNLIDIATQSGGNYINLLRLEYTKAVQLLKKETYQFLGVKHNGSVHEIYPKQFTNVYQDFAISGQFTEDSTIELLFGYGGKVTAKIPVKIKTTEGTKEVKRLWAKQKLKNLYRAKEENKGAIISLAKQYSLITDYTSMIILDRIQDYVRYKIEPPKELMAQYKQRMQTAKIAEKQREQQLAYRRRDLLKSYQSIDMWYQADFEFESQTNSGYGNILTLHGVITDDTGMPLPGAPVRIKGTNTGVMTNFDGEYKIKVRRGQKVVVSYIGYKSKEMEVRSNFLKTELELSEELQEVTIVAYDGAVNSTKVASAIATVDGKTIEQVPINSLDQVLKGTAAGIRVNTGSGQPRQSNRVITGSEGSGVFVQTGSGQPGQNNNIIIRGRNSIQGTIEPLILIDGKVVDQGALRSLQKEDIQNVGVLKNEEATAIYGSRGANGVIIVKTKEAADKIKLKPWSANMPYIKVLQQESTVAEAYKKYLEIRKEYASSPTFYLDVADFFHSRKATTIAVTVITNLLEIELHNYELLKAAAYKLEYFERYEMAVLAYEKVLELRPEEPQSYRDLALAYEEVGKIRESYDLLYKLYDGQLLKKDESRRFTGVEQIAYVELSRLVSKHAKKLKLTKEEQQAFTAMPVDVRIVIDWNHNETDIDLWVFDPNGGKANFQNPSTQIGGRMSNDLRQGYGPEEFMLRNAIKGTYNVYVNHFADRVQKISGPTILKVTMYTNYGKKNEKKKITIVRLKKKRGELEVGSLIFRK